MLKITNFVNFSSVLLTFACPCYCFTWNNLLLMFHVKRSVNRY
nr:MAG TPA: hypothetical protein [Caudoviricetes sp.]